MSTHAPPAARHRIRRAAAVSIASAALAAGTLVTAGTAAAAGGPAASAPDWGTCPDPAEAGLQCATVTVPVDYDHPSGKTLKVAISRLPATDQAHRRGVMLLNPGGPGGPGLDLPNSLATLGMPASVLAQYDLVGFDPRGIGHSSPVSCHLSTAQIGRTFPPYAAKASDVDAYAKVAKKIAGQCQQHDDGTLRHLTTENTARDMDRIRLVLGEKKISYLGVSYGTYLGAVYSTLFPQRTDRVVLDSAVGPPKVWYGEFRAWGPATEIRFPDFARWAAARDGTYELGRTPAAVRKNYLALAHRLDEQPAGAIDGSLFRQVVHSALYSDSSFPSLAQLWQQLQGGDPARALRTATAAKLAPSAADQSSAATQLAVLCNDTGWSRSLTTYKRAVAQDRPRYPLFGASAANVYACAYWPKPLDKTVRITDDGPSNILVLQNRRDPATIYGGGVQMARTLGKRARLVSVDAGGHGSYLYLGNACVDNLTTRYLAHGTFPSSDRTCGPTTTSAKGTSAAKRAAIADLQSRMRLG